MIEQNNKFLYVILAVVAVLLALAPVLVYEDGLASNHRYEIAKVISKDTDGLKFSNGMGLPGYWDINPYNVGEYYNITISTFGVDHIYGTEGPYYSINGVH